MNFLHIPVGRWKKPTVTKILFMEEYSKKCDDIVKSEKSTCNCLKMGI